RIGVAGFPHGAGGNGPVAGDAIFAHDAGEVGENLDAYLQPFLGKMPVGKRVFAQLGSPAEPLKRRESSVRTDLRYLHTNRARTNIDGVNYSCSLEIGHCFWVVNHTISKIRVC